MIRTWRLKSYNLGFQSKMKVMKMNAPLMVPSCEWEDTRMWKMRNRDKLVCFYGSQEQVNDKP